MREVQYFQSPDKPITERDGLRIVNDHTAIIEDFQAVPPRSFAREHGSAIIHTQILYRGDEMIERVIINIYDENGERVSNIEEGYI